MVVNQLNCFLSLHQNLLKNLNPNDVYIHIKHAINFIDELHEGTVDWGLMSGFQQPIADMDY